MTALADGSPAARQAPSAGPGRKRADGDIRPQRSTCAMPAATSPKPCADAACAGSLPRPQSRQMAPPTKASRCTGRPQIGAAHLDAVLANAHCGSARSPTRAVYSLQATSAQAPRGSCGATSAGGVAGEGPAPCWPSPAPSASAATPGGSGRKDGGNRGPDDYLALAERLGASSAELPGWGLNPPGPCTLDEEPSAPAFDAVPAARRRRRDAVVGVQHRAQADVGGGPAVFM
ncbi:hypothetical protein ACPA9J_02075 [Pseudomonas aeruginosa]